MSKDCFTLSNKDFSPLFGRAILGLMKRGYDDQALLQCLKFSSSLNNVHIQSKHLDLYCQTLGFTSINTVPMTYLHNFSFLLNLQIMTRWQWPFSIVGMIHTHNSITQKRNILPHEVLNFTCEITRFERIKKGTIVDFLSTAYINNELVWQDKSSYLKLNNRPSTDNKKNNYIKKEAYTLDSHQNIYLSKNDAKHFANISHDSNPIHTSNILAKAFGLKSSIIHGMWTKSRCFAELDKNRTGDKKTISVDFNKPIFLPKSNNEPTILNLQSREIKNGSDFIVTTESDFKLHLKGILTSHS